MRRREGGTKDTNFRKPIVDLAVRAAVILADCAVLGGAPDAASSCIDLKHLARNYADHPRMIIATALRGVAIYHQHICPRA